MDRTPTLFQKALAELLGTGFLVLIGPGSIPAAILLLNGGKIAFTMADLGFIALAFAVAIAAMVYTIGHISGCHINPAVTLAFAVTKRIPWNEALVYIIAQFIGGILGALGHVEWNVLDRRGKSGAENQRTLQRLCRPRDPSLSRKNACCSCYAICDERKSELVSVSRARHCLHASVFSWTLFAD